MLSRNANLSTSQMLARLREGARPFPTSVADDPAILTCHVPANDQDFQLAQCLCTDQRPAAPAWRTPPAPWRRPTARSRPWRCRRRYVAGQNVSLNAAGSAAACGRTVAGYAWTVVAPATNPPAIVGANTATATVIAPTTGRSPCASP